MKGIVAIPALGLGLLLAGCSEPTIDASSEEAFYQSSGQVFESLNPEGQERFTEALMNLAMSGLDWDALFTGKASQDQDLSAMLQHLDGLTAEEVVAMGEEARQLPERLAQEQAERDRERRRDNWLEDF